MVKPPLIHLILVEMDNLPKIKEQLSIERTTLFDSRYVFENKVWNATTLIKQAEKEGNNVFDYDLRCLPLQDRWYNLDCADLAETLTRVSNTNLKYPIILTNAGGVADGFHRVVKAIVEGKQAIKAIRLINMPEPDEIEESNN